MDAVIVVINFLFSVFYLILVVRALLPWIPHNRQTPLILWFNSLTDPLLNPIRLGLPPAWIGMDVSPFVLLILLWLVQKGIIFVLTGVL